MKKVVHQGNSCSLLFNINLLVNIILTHSELLWSKKRLDMGQPSKPEAIIKIMWFSKGLGAGDRVET